MFDKIHKPQAGWSENDKNERSDIRRDSTDIKRVIRKYCDQLHTSKSDDLIKWENSLKDTTVITHIVNWMPMYLKEIGFLVRNLPTHPQPHTSMATPINTGVFLGEFHHLRKK